MPVSISLHGAEETRAWLHTVPPSLRRNLRRENTKAAQPITGEMRRLAATGKGDIKGSTRIPGAIYVRTTFGASTAAVSIGVSRSKAPHARVHARTSTFRHPVFGNRERWEPQTPLNFWRPAISHGRATVRAGVQKAITDTLRTH